MDRKIYQLQQELLTNLAEYAGRKITASDAEVICSLATAAEKLKKLEMFDYGEDYSGDDWPMNDGYSGRRYYRDSGMNYDRGESYRGRDARGRYTRDDGMEHMMTKLKDMERDTDDPRVKEALHKAMDRMR